MEEPRDRRERTLMRIASTMSWAGIAVAVIAWFAWSITAFLGGRLALLGLRSTGGVGVGLVWLVLLGFQLLATVTLGIGLIVLRSHHRPR